MATESPLALCHCGAPLIATLAFRGYEFYCVECGVRLDFLSPLKGDAADPELAERYAGLKAEWDENVGGKLLVPGAHRRDCDRCLSRGESHIQHATDEERKANADARAWMWKRAGSSDG